MSRDAGLDPRHAARATAFALVATALEKGGAMVLLLAIARMLGADDFGRYAAVMALVAVVQLGAELGQEPVLVRLLAQRSAAEAAPLVDGALAMRLALATAGALSATLLGLVLLPGIGTLPLAVAGCGLVAASGAVLRAVFRTEQRLEWSCLTALANVAAFAGALALAHRLGLGLVGAVAAWGAGQLATSSAALAIVRRTRPVRPRWRPAVAATLARSGWPLAANGILLTITLRVGQVVVLRFAGAVESGYLAAGSRLAEAFALLPEALMLVLLPVLSAYDATARDAQRALTVRVVRWLGLLALTVVVAVSVAAPSLMTVLFGARYAPGVPALRISIWLALLAATGSVFTNLLVARGLERVLLAVNAIASVLTVALSLVIVPRLGFVGAAAVSLAANATAQLLLAVVPALRLELAACARPLVMPALLALALALAGARVGGAPLVAGAAAASLFVAVMLVTGAVGIDDWRALRRVLPRRRGMGPPLD